MKTTALGKGLIALCILLVTSFAGALSPVSAATLTVTTTADELNANGHCSLREAITNVNNGVTTWPDCAPTGAYGTGNTINIPSGTYMITIAGAGEDANATGDFDIKTNVAITGAGAATTIINGGGLDRVFHIIGAYTVSISGVTITGGSAPGDAGGGIYNYGGALTVMNSTVSLNSSVVGGGLYNEGYLAPGSTLTVINSTVSNNSTTSAGGGGILNNFGALTVINSTISSNVTPAYGGGINTAGTVTITNATITGNSAGTGGGIHNSGGTFILSHTIVAAQTSGGDCSGGGYSSGGFNLESGTDCGFTGTGDLQNTDPKLGPLQNNGGQTFTHALLGGSPAINVIPDGADGCGTTITNDQRGFSRPRPAGGFCDIGAFEAECVQPPSGLVSWWGGDNNALDMAGTSNGTLVNGATYAAGKVGQAFSFDGINDYISAALVSTATIDVTMDAWVKWGGPNNANSIQRIFYSGNSATNGYGVYVKNDGTLFLVMGGHDAPDIDAKLTAGVWYHLAVVRQSSTNWKVYLNGAEVSVALTMSSYPDVPTGNTFIGGSTTGLEPFKGLIDEVQFFNRTLSASEITAIYQAGSDGQCRFCAAPPSGMIAWWGGDDNALDTAGGNNGTLTGGATYALGKVGQAFSLDDAEAHVSLPDFLPPDDITVDAWIYISSTFRDGVASIWGVGNAVGMEASVLWVSRQNMNNLNWDISTTASDRFVWQGSYSFQTDQWYHVALTQTGGPVAQPVMYVNGAVIPVTASMAGGTPAHKKQPMGIGSYGGFTGQYSFTGLIDEVEIFSRALSADEIAAVYNAGSAGKCAVPMLKREPSNTYYDHFADAFLGAESGNNILMRTGSITEDADYNNAGVLLNLRGGCNLDFVPDILKYSTISGSLKITGGGMSIGNIIVQ